MVLFKQYWNALFVAALLFLFLPVVSAEPIETLQWMRTEKLYTAWSVATAICNNWEPQSASETKRSSTSVIGIKEKPIFWSDDYATVWGQSINHEVLEQVCAYNSACANWCDAHCEGTRGKDIFANYVCPTASTRYGGKVSLYKYWQMVPEHCTATYAANFDYTLGTCPPLPGPAESYGAPECIGYSEYAPNVTGDCVSNADNTEKICAYWWSASGMPQVNEGTGFSIRGTKDSKGCQQTAVKNVHELFCYTTQSILSGGDFPESRTRGTDSLIRTEKKLQITNNACDDAKKCTVDSCDGNTECVFTPIPCCEEDKKAVCSNSQCILVDCTPPNCLDGCSTNADCGETHSACDCGGNPYTCTCSAASGPGRNECSYDADCLQTHSACVNQTCTVVPGPGRNECDSDVQCKPYHTICDYEGGYPGCKTVPGAGWNECFMAADCGWQVETHTICVPGGNGNYCTSVPGPGRNECNNNLDCEDYHTVCSNQECLTVTGAGPNQCSDDPDCAATTHLECVNQQCKPVSEPGLDQCKNVYECVDSCAYHYACNGPRCERVEGTGADECLSDAACQETHAECDNSSCITVVGPGTDQCQTSNDCEHTECINNGEACVVVPGPGDDQCSLEMAELRQSMGLPACGGTECVDNACVPSTDPNQHDCVMNADCIVSVCDNLTCVQQSCSTPPCGENEDECSSNLDCEDELHLECEDFQCVEKPGAGIDECASNSNCVFSKCQDYACITVTEPLQPGDIPCSTNWDCDWHLACDATNVCMPVFGPPQQGERLCTDTWDCTHYLGCENGACREIEGTGQTDECDSNSDCRHTVCDFDNSQCNEELTPGISQCTTFADCGQHTECNYYNQTCDVVQGYTESQCNAFDDCTRLKCVDLSCVLVNEIGSNECDVNSDCVPALPENACKSALQTRNHASKAEIASLTVK